MSSFASSASPVRSCPRSAPSTTARWSNVARPASVQATSRPSNSGWPAKWVDSRAACAFSAVGDLADSTIGSTAGVAELRTTDGADADSTITWALVPLIPNDEMPARRGVSPAGQGCASVSSATEPAVQSTCGLGSSTCNVAGSASLRIAMIILITPATPAAAWVWPMFDFTDPSHNGRARSCP